MQTQFLTDSFLTAKENMEFDTALVQECLQKKEQRIFRFYSWQKPGITYSEKRVPDEILLKEDASARVTGGGVVFHSPGDVVFSAIISKEDPHFPKGLKGKMESISRLIQSGFSQCDIAVSIGSKDEQKAQDIMFCSTYYNPYELYFGSEKICGIALRKYRDMVVFQGVIHFQDTASHFKHLSGVYEPVFTKGLTACPDLIDNQQLINALRHCVAQV